ncbi:MAG: endonuclease/exonuclease/phosphatase family protein [Flammeovirgaceae bacterium]
MNQFKYVALGMILLVACGSVSIPVDDNTYSIAFYNVENLFDIEDDPDTNDEEFLPTSSKAWDKAKYKLKLANLARSISQIGDEDGPEVLGLCEVENQKVLQDLVKHKLLRKNKYQIVHHESPDHRGIDNALIFKKKAFELTSSKAFKVEFPDDPAYTTRSILLVTGLLKGEEIHFIVNHFPSRRGGLKASEPRRIQAATKLREIVESLMEIKSRSKIIVMGDFNDEPTNRSIREVLKAKGNSFDANKQELYNTLSHLDQQGKGSYNYRGNWQMLDQIILSGSVHSPASGWTYVPKSANVYAPEWLKQQTPEKYKGTPLRTFAGKKYLKGYSDHFPVFIHLRYKE